MYLLPSPTPHAGRTILIVGLHLPQLSTPEGRHLALQTLEWAITLSRTYPTHITLLGGDFQFNIHNPPTWATDFTNTLIALTQPMATFRPASTCLDQWLAHTPLPFTTCTTTHETTFTDHRAITAIVTSSHAPLVFQPRSLPPTTLPPMDHFILTPFTGNYRSIQVVNRRTSNRSHHPQSNP